MKGHFVAALFCAASAMFLLVKGEMIKYNIKRYKEFEGTILGCNNGVYHNYGDCVTGCLYDDTCMGFQYVVHRSLCRFCNKTEVTGFENKDWSVIREKYYLIRHFTLFNIPVGSFQKLYLQKYLPGDVVYYKMTMLRRPRFDVKIRASNGATLLHLDFRRKWRNWKNKILFADKLHGTWHTRKVIKYPVPVGQTFEVYILITKDQFDIVINQVHITTYKLRAPLSDVLFAQNHPQAAFQEFSV